MKLTPHSDTLAVELGPRDLEHWRSAFEAQVSRPTSALHGVDGLLLLIDPADGPRVIWLADDTIGVCERDSTLNSANSANSALNSEIEKLACACVAWAARRLAQVEEQPS